MTLIDIQLGGTSAPGSPFTVDRYINSGVFKLVFTGTAISGIETSGTGIKLTDGRLQNDKGANITAANDLTLGTDGNTFTVTGNTTVNAITATNWQSGSWIILEMTGTPLFKHNTVGGAGTLPMKLAGSVDFQAAADDSILFYNNGSFWHELARKLAASGAITANNALTMSTTTNVQLGHTTQGDANSPLLHHTYINTTGAFTLTISGNGTTTNLAVANNSISSGNVIEFSSSSTAAASSTQTVLRITTSGANSNSSQSTYAIRASNSHTGSVATNIAIYGEISNGISSSTAVYGNALGDQIGVRGQSVSNYGGFFVSSSGIAVSSTTTTGAVSGIFISNPASTNTTQGVLRLLRTTSGTAANNIAGSLEFYNEDDAGGANGQLSNELISKWTTAANATRTSQFIITGVNSAVTADLLTIYGTGQHQFNKYGVGTFTGTAAKWLAVTSAGLIIEEAPPTGTTITADNGLTMSTATNVQFGGTLIQTTTINTGGFKTTWTGSNANNTFEVNNTNTASGSYAFAGLAAANVAAVSGTNTGTGGGLQGTAVSGNGVIGIATTGLAGAFTVNPSSTSTVVNVIELTRNTTGTAANGMGGRIQYTLENSAGTRLAATLDAVWTDVTDGTRTTDFIISTVNSATTNEVIRFAGNKRVILSGRLETQQGADVASAAGAIAVGLDGNVFELTGTNAVTLISNLNWVNGSMITFLFTSTATLTDGTANSGTDIGMELAGNANFVGTADDVITLVLCEIGGTQRWREVSRSVN